MSSSTAAADLYAVDFEVAPDHPCLPGHFPGQPVVPGVLLLDQALAACEQWLDAPVRLRALPQVKFLQPLLPGQPARIELQRSVALSDAADAAAAHGQPTAGTGGAFQVRVRVVHEARLVATAVLELGG